MKGLPLPAPEIIAVLVKELEDAGRTGFAEILRMFYPDPADTEVLLPGMRVEKVEINDFRFDYGNWRVEGSISFDDLKEGEPLASFFYRLAMPPEKNPYPPIFVFVIDQLCLDAALRFRGDDGLGLDSSPCIYQTSFLPIDL